MHMAVSSPRVNSSDEVAWNIDLKMGTDIMLASKGLFIPTGWESMTKVS